MERPKLNLDDLKIETFEPQQWRPGGTRGTVFGYDTHDTCAFTCAATCFGATCDGATCQTLTPCCEETFGVGCHETDHCTGQTYETAGVCGPECTDDCTWQETCFESCTCETQQNLVC